MRGGKSLVVLVVAVTLLAGLGSGSAAAGQKKLVEGTVYDTTCVTVCVPGCPPPPHCGPIKARARGAVVCAQRMIACPLSDSTPQICLQGNSCGGTYPVYSGEGAVVNVRKRGSTTVLATLPVVEGRFQIRLGPGEYVLHPYLPEESCWSGASGQVKVVAGERGPISTSLDVTNRCVAQPNAEG